MKKSVKNLTDKQVKNTQTVKGGENGRGTRNTASHTEQTQQAELL